MSPPLLLTPGPLTTHARVREAMTRDWGSRDRDFIALTAELREGLLAVANGAGTHVAVPIQGAGTYALEAAAASLVGPDDRLLVLVNGAYGRRMVEIARRLGRPVTALVQAEDAPFTADTVRAAIKADPAVTCVSLVHVETTTGLLNPLEPVARAVADAGRRLIVDAMASFGALPIDLAATPGRRRARLVQQGPGGAAGDQLRPGGARVAGGLRRSLAVPGAGPRRPGAGLRRQRAVALHPARAGGGGDGGGAAAAGGGGRSARAPGPLRENLRVLVEGVEPLGFPLYLRRDDQAPIIATFRHGPELDFARFYDALAERGFVIYPGKLTAEPSFRIGCIGQVFPQDMRRLVQAVAEVTSSPA